MDAKTFERARSAYQMQFALQTFKSVKAGISALLDRGFTPDSPEYYPLIVGLICLYGRPFKSNRPGGKLDSKLVPEKYKKLHDELISIRDRTIAHSDASAAAVPGQVANELRFRREAHRIDNIEGDRIGSFITRFLVEPWYFKQMIPLLEHLIQETDNRTQELCGGLSKQLPKAKGQYLVNVTNPDGPLFTKPEKIIEDVRHSDF
jgi:hypothetical protein